MHSEAQNRALDVCIQKIQSGDRLEHALEMYPTWAAELTPPLEAVQTLRVYTETFSAPAKVTESSRASFLETAQQLRRANQESRHFSKWSLRLATAAFVLLAIAGLLWLFAAASIALPGERLYPIRMITWQARRLANNDPAKRLELELAYDAARLDELHALSDLRRGAPVSFAGLLQGDKPDDWRAAGFPLIVSAQTQVVGKITPGIWVEVTGKLLPNGTIELDQVRPREYILSGLLQMVSPQSLSIANIPVQLNQNTLVHGSPMAGSEVNVVAFRTAENSLLARLVDAQE